jgi:hypothetical protein
MNTKRKKLLVYVSQAYVNECIEINAKSEENVK